MRSANNKRRVLPYPAAGGGGGPGLSLYQWRMLLFAFIFFSIVIVSISMALAFSAPTARNTVVGPIVVPPYTTAPRPNTSVATTTPVPTTTIVTTTPVPTTTPVVYPPINITCPSNVTVPVGASLEPQDVNGFAVGGGGCTPPVITYVDTVISTQATKKKRSTLERMDGTIEQEEDSGGQMPLFSKRSENNVFGTVVHPTAADGVPRAPRINRGEIKLRSPSFPTNQLFVQGTPLTTNGDSGVLRSDYVNAVSKTHVVALLNTASGTRVQVTDKSTVLLGSFMLNTIGGAGANCSGPVTLGSGQVVWDYLAQKWVLLEMGNSGSNLICIYVSVDSNPLGSYMSFSYDFSPHFPNYPRLGLWPQVYGLTLAKPPLSLTDEPHSLCVISRSALLSYNNSASPTKPSIFCAAPYNGRLPRFGDFQSWSPATVADGGIFPPSTTESISTGTASALFFRHVDDELHRNATTPSYDAIETEQWTHIDFSGNGSYTAIRYFITAADFDSSFANCTSQRVCIPTPDAQKLNPVREILTGKAAFRKTVTTGRESIVLTLTSHANGLSAARIYWFELRFFSPYWYVYQQGVLVSPSNTTHQFQGSAVMDANGNIAVGYTQSSATEFPSMYVRARLGNDPLIAMRQPLFLFAGAAGSIFPSGSEWGYSSVISPDSSDGGRTFFLTSQISSAAYPWTAKLVKLRLLGEIIQRVWKAQDTCYLPFATCTQIITTVDSGPPPPIPNTTTVLTTTAAPTSPPTGPLAILCPANEILSIGDSIQTPPLPNATATGGCLPRTINYTDAITGTVARRLSRSAPPNINVVVQLSGAITDAGFTYSPADPTLDVGIAFFVTAHNNRINGTQIRVYDKLTLALQSSFILNTLAPSGTDCSLYGAGNPQVYYDQGFDRWVLMESTNTSNDLCFYVSSTGNPASSSWAHYRLGTPQAPRYPKLGYFGSDTLIVTTYETPSPAVYFINRNSLFGTTASTQWFRVTTSALSGFSGVYQAWTPVHVDSGSLPLQPTHLNGGIVIRHNDDELHSGSPNATFDFIDVIHFQNVNYTTSSATQVAYQIPLDLDFNSSIAALVSAPGTTTLDPVRQVVMDKAHYRRIVLKSNQQSIVASWSVVGGGVYWVELRPQSVNSSTWGVYQRGIHQGNYTPDATNCPLSNSCQRFLPSIAMDSHGTIAAIYSVTGASKHLSLAVSTQVATDPLNTWRRDFELAAGGAPAYSTSNKWGTYFGISSDPTADRIFFSIGMYSPAGTSNWELALRKFKITGDIIQRTWRVYDSCLFTASCVQTITLQ